MAEDAGAEDEVGFAGFDGGEERENFGGDVAAVGVHEDDDSGVGWEGGDGAEAGVAVAAAGLGKNAGTVGGGDFGGAVFRAVVDDEDFGIDARGESVEDAADGLLLVQSRNDEDRFHGLGDGGGAACSVFRLRDTTTFGLAPPRLPEGVSDALKYWPDLRVWLRDIVISVAIAAVIITFLYQPVKVEGTSMLPRLEDQERIFINKFVYRFDSIEQGDIVVFRYPWDTSKSYIKRVIGLPGDTVEIRGGEVLVNGAGVEEPYLREEYRDEASHGPVVVEDGEYYVLGDHRNTSNDSRSWGTVPQSFIIGKAVFAYWPPERFGVLE